MYLSLQIQTNRVKLNTADKTCVVTGYSGSEVLGTNCGNMGQTVESLEHGKVKHQKLLR